MARRGVLLRDCRSFAGLVINGCASDCRIDAATGASSKLWKRNSA